VTPAIDVRSRPSTCGLDIWLPEGKSRQLLLSVSIVRCEPLSSSSPRLQPQAKVNPLRHRLKGVLIPSPHPLKGILSSSSPRLQPQNEVNPFRHRLKGILIPPPALPAALRLSSKPDAILSCQGGGDFDVQAGTELSAEQVVSVTQRTKTIEQPHSNGGDFDSDHRDSLTIVELPRQHHLGWKQHDSVFGGTGEWSGRYGGVARRSVAGQVCFLQRTTAGALGVSRDVTPGRSTLPAVFASRIHQPLRLQPHQQLKQPQQQQSGLPLEQVTQITPWEVIPPVPQEHYLEPPQSIHWQQHQSWQQRLICTARAVPPQRSESKVNTTPAAGAVLPARFAADDAASPPLQQQQPQRPQQLSASLVAKSMENQCSCHSSRGRGGHAADSCGGPFDVGGCTGG